MAQTKEILKHKGTEITKTIMRNGMAVTKRKVEAQQHGNKRRKFFSVAE
jgi:ribosome-interacting GTPase 1